MKTGVSHNHQIICECSFPILWIFPHTISWLVLRLHWYRRNSPTKRSTYWIELHGRSQLCALWRLLTSIPKTELCSSMQWMFRKSAVNWILNWKSRANWRFDRNSRYLLVIKLMPVGGWFFRFMAVYRYMLLSSSRLNNNFALSNRSFFCSWMNSSVRFAIIKLIAFSLAARMQAIALIYSRNESTAHGNIIKICWNDDTKKY